jgi:hypothetical protein
METWPSTPTSSVSVDGLAVITRVGATSPAQDSAPPPEQDTMAAAIVIMKADRAYGVSVRPRRWVVRDAGMCNPAESRRLVRHGICACAGTSCRSTPQLPAGSRCVSEASGTADRCGTARFVAYCNISRRSLPCVAGRDVAWPSANDVAALPGDRISRTSAFGRSRSRRRIDDRRSPLTPAVRTAAATGGGGAAHQRPPTSLRTVSTSDGVCRP